MMGGDDLARRARENSHPVRAAILELHAATTSALSPGEVAAMLRVPVAQVEYHVRVLAAIGELHPARTGQGDRASGILYSYRPGQEGS